MCVCVSVPAHEGLVGVESLEDVTEKSRVDPRQARHRLRGIPEGGVRDTEGVYIYIYICKYIYMYIYQRSRREESR